MYIHGKMSLDFDFSLITYEKYDPSIWLSMK